LKIVAKTASSRMIDVTIWAMLAYFLIWMLVIDAPGNSPEVFKSYAGVIIVWAMLFMMGRLLPVYRGGILLLALGVYAVIALLTLANTESGTFTPAQSAEFATYQAYAVILAIVTFVLMYGIAGELKFWMIVVSSIILFAITGSRSELVAIAFIAVIIANLRKPSIAMIGVQVVGVAALYIAYLYLISGDGNMNRFSYSFEERAEASVSGRSELNGLAWNTILANPATGDFASYDDGAYAHNLLSVWVDFGLAGFVIYLWLMCVSLYAVLVRAPKPFDERKNLIAVALWIFCAFLLILTKSGDYYMVPFVMGILASHDCRVTARPQMAHSV
jgi:hypothetical protein